MSLTLAFTVSDLPALNAALNTTATVLLVCGFLLIRAGRRRAHRNCMIAALGTSAAFLTSYLIYHFYAQTMTPFSGPAALKPYYLIMLVSHVLLAAAVPPLAVVVVVLAARGQLQRHRRLARVTLPIWLYVSVTGVVIYWTLYHLWPAPPTR